MNFNQNTLHFIKIRSTILSTIIFTIAMLAIVPACNVSAAGQATINNNVFEPFFVRPAIYKVYDANQVTTANPEGGFLGTVNLATTTTPFTPTDPSIYVSNYPGVEVRVSEPFVVDPSGNSIEDPEYAMTNPDDEVQIVVDGDTIYYARKFWFGVDVGVRTRSNLPVPRYYSSYVSPLDDFYTSHEGRTDYDTFDGDGGWSYTLEPNEEGFNNHVINAGSYDINTRDKLYTSLFDSMAFQSNTRRVTDKTSKYWENDAEPYGIIGAAVNMNARPWNVQWFNQATRAQIFNSLYDVRPYLNGGGVTAGYNPDPDFYAGNWLSDMDTYLATSFGNKAVKVRVNSTINLGGNLMYNFDVPQSDGSVLQVRSTSAELGFYNMRQITSHRSFGIVANYFNDAIRDLELQSGLPQNDQDDETDDELTDAEARSGEVPGTTVYSESAYFTWRGITQTPVTGQADPIVNIGSNLFEMIDANELYYKNIDITGGELNLPERLSFQVEFDVQPITIVNWANYDLRYAYRLYDLANPGYFNEYNHGLKTIRYPAQVEMQNVYAEQRVVFSIFCLSEISGYIVPSDGVPFQIEDWAEFNVNTLGSIVDLSSFSVVSQTTTFDLLKFFADLFSNPTSAILFIIILVASIIVLYFVLQIVRSRLGFVPRQRKPSATRFKLGSLEYEKETG